MRRNPLTKERLRAAALIAGGIIAAGAIGLIAGMAISARLSAPRSMQTIR